MYYWVGARRTKKYVGLLPKRPCLSCGVAGYHLLRRTTTWFALMFTPVIPLKHEYAEYCPACKIELKLEQPEIDEVKPGAAVNLSLANKTITQEQYAVSSLSIPTPLQLNLSRLQEVIDFGQRHDLVRFKVPLLNKILGVVLMIAGFPVLLLAGEPDNQYLIFLIAVSGLLMIGFGRQLTKRTSPLIDF